MVVGGFKKLLPTNWARQEAKGNRKEAGGMYGSDAR